jgi:hypothetical protein
MLNNDQGEYCEKTGTCTNKSTRFNESYGNLCESCFKDLIFVCNRLDDLVITAFMEGHHDYLLDPEHDGDWTEMLEDTFYTEV